MLSNKPKLRSIYLVLALVVCILGPGILNGIWYGGGPEWTYWAVGFLVSAELLILGSLMVFAPRSTRDWWVNNMLSPKQRAEQRPWNLAERIKMGWIGLLGLILPGGVFLYITIRSLIIHMSNP